MAVSPNSKEVIYEACREVPYGDALVTTFQRLTYGRTVLPLTDNRQGVSAGVDIGDLKSVPLSAVVFRSEDNVFFHLAQYKAMELDCTEDGWKWQDTDQKLILRATAGKLTPEDELLTLRNIHRPWSFGVKLDTPHPQKVSRLPDVSGFAPAYYTALNIINGEVFRINGLRTPGYFYPRGEMRRGLSLMLDTGTHQGMLENFDQMGTQARDLRTKGLVNYNLDLPIICPN